MCNSNLWCAVFIDPRGKRYAEDDMQRTAFIRFDQMHTGSLAWPAKANRG